MREFWNDNRQTVVRLILNQFGATVMGLLVTAAAHSNDTLMLCASLFSTVFYLVLLYCVIWERGGKERIRIDGGRAAWKPLYGLYMGLLANIPNFVLAILILIGKIFGSLDGPFGYEWAGNLYAITNVITRLWIPFPAAIPFCRVFPSNSACQYAGGYVYWAWRSCWFGLFSLYNVNKPMKKGMLK